MTRRRTSVIGPGRAQDFAAAPSSPEESAEGITHWGLVAARELSLNLLGDSRAEAERLADVRRRWRIAQGRLSGNPAPSTGRSEVTRIAAGANKAFWRKHFAAQQVLWQLNELDVLNYLGTMDRSSAHGLRDHVGWMRQVNTNAASSSLQTVETLDAGPSLDDWQEFSPCSEVQGLPLPLFVRAEFLAALTRQILIGLDKLAEFGVVHNDLKPSNLCLALPTAFARQGHVWRASWDLQRLPLRFIDFELAFRPDVRPVQAHSNPWVSPFARACHAAAAQAHADDRVSILNGIDWGADLWSLGYMLAEWTQQAQSFLDAWLSAVRTTWGDASSVYLNASQVVMQQSRQLGHLSRLVGDLQAEDRPLTEAGKARLAVRAARPHAALRLKLEAAFPALGPGAKRSEQPFTLIEPEAPLHLPPPRRWGAWWRGATGASRAAVGRHRKTLIWGAAALAGGAGLWANAATVASWSADRYADFNYHLANAWRDDGWEAQHALLKKTVHWYLPGAQAGVVRSVGKEPAWQEPNGDVVLAAQRARLRSLRALAQWYEVAASTHSDEGRAQVEQLLLTLYKAQNRLEALGAGRTHTEGVPEALGHAWFMLDAVQDRWPLASMLALHLRACYLPEPVDLTQYLRHLTQVPANAPSAHIYRAYAQAVQGRLDSGASPCLIAQATPTP